MEHDVVGILLRYLRETDQKDLADLIGGNLTKSGIHVKTWKQLKSLLSSFPDIQYKIFPLLTTIQQLEPTDTNPEHHEPEDETSEGGHDFHMGGGHPEKPEQVRGDLMKNDEDYKKIKQDLEDKEKFQKALSSHEQTLKDKFGKEEYKKLTEDKTRREELKEELAEAEFRKKHQDKAEEYDKLEEKQVYLDPKNDPLCQKKQKEIDEAVEKEYQNKIKKNPTITREQIRKNIASGKWQEFVEKYNNKAVYGAENPEIEAAGTRAFGNKTFKNKWEDPQYQIALKKAQIEAKKTIAQKKEAGETLDQHQTDSLQKQTQRKHLESFARQFEKKAREYKKTDPELQSAYDSVYPGGKKPSPKEIEGSRQQQEFIRQNQSWKQREAARLQALKEQIRRKFIQPVRDDQDQEQPQFSGRQMEELERGFTPSEQLSQQRLGRAGAGEGPPRSPGPRLPEQGLSPNLNGSLPFRSPFGNLASKLGLRAAPLVANPWFWIILGIVLLIIFIIIIIIIIINGGSPEDKKNFPIKGLTLEKHGPSKIENGANIPYTINASYFGTEDIVLEDKIPANTEFVSASGNYSSQSGVIKWRLKDNLGETGGLASASASVGAETTDDFSLSNYPGFPAPNPPDGEGMTPSEVSRWKTYVMPYVVKAGGLLNVDPVVVGMWSWLETGFYPYASNCHDNDSVRNNQNNYCPKTLKWQVGGAQVQDHLKDLPEAFAAMHQDESVQQVGQKIIDNSASRSPNGDAISQPSATFPAVSIEKLSQDALSGDQNSRWFAATLMKDDAISAYMNAKTLSAILKSRLAQTLNGYGDEDHFAPQKVINLIRGIYKAGVIRDAKRQIGIVKQYSFSLILHPTKDDVVVINSATAKVIGGTANGIDTSSVVPDTTDFTTLFKGQGRNTTIIGDLDSFVQNAIKNGRPYNFDKKQDEVGKIYKMAVSKNVNPLIVLTLWIEEGGAGQNNGLPFGCDPYKKRHLGFDANLECAIDTLNFWMEDFQKNKKPDGTHSLKSELGKSCVYDDEFVYAAEKYGPVCAAYDQNDYYHSNMVKYFRMLLGK